VNNIYFLKLDIEMRKNGHGNNIYFLKLDNEKGWI